MILVLFERTGSVDLNSFRLRTTGGGEGLGGYRTGEDERAVVMFGDDEVNGFSRVVYKVFEPFEGVS